MLTDVSGITTNSSSVVLSNSIAIDYDDCCLTLQTQQIVTEKMSRDTLLQ